MSKKIVNLNEYKTSKAIKKQIDELDALHELYTDREPDPMVRKGYINFMKFLKALDKKYGDKNDNL